MAFGKNALSSTAARFLGVLSVFAAIFVVGVIAIGMEARKKPEKRHKTTIWVGLCICALVMVFAILLVVMTLFNEF